MNSLTEIARTLALLTLGLSSPAWAGPPAPAGDVGQPVVVQPGGGGDQSPEPLFDPVYQISTGPTGLYEIWSLRSTASPSVRLGYLVVTDGSPPTGFTKFYEHFIWNVQASWPGEFYVKSSANLPTDALFTGSLSVDKFNNRIGCSRPGKELSGTSQWEVRIQTLTEPHVANLIKKRPRPKVAEQLLGYWKSSTSCKSIDVGTDGWMDFKPPAGTFAPKSSGTPTK